MACGGSDAATGPTPPPPPPPTTVAQVDVSPGTGHVVSGDTLRLHATPKDAQGNVLSGRSVTWNSSQPSVATVSQGLVTAIAPGSATISATVEGRVGTATVTVVSPPPVLVAVAQVEVTPDARELIPGDTVRLLATPRDADGNVLTGRVVAWSSSQPAVFTVNDEGLITAVAPGSATATATIETRTATASITVVSPLPAPSCMDCLEVVPASLLLTTVGAQQQLSAFLVSATGERTPVSATFSSAKPAVVAVTPTGLASATGMGSAQLSAVANGRTSVPVMVMVTQPAQGVTLVRDDQVSVGAAPVDANASFGLGYRYTVTLRNLQPVVGQLLVSSGSTPILGRVTRVTPMAGGLIEAELEMRPLDELLPNLSVNEQWTLDATGGTPTAFTSRGAMVAADEEPLEEGQFRLGPFICKSENGARLSFPLTLEAISLGLNPTLQSQLVVENGRLRRFTVFGGLEPQVDLTPKLTSSIESSLECRRVLFRPRIPVSGALAMVITPSVPIGVGFKFEAKSQITGVGFRSRLRGRLGFSAGIDCPAGVCTRVWSPEAGLTASFETVLEGLGDTRTEVSAGLFAFATVKVSNQLAESIAERFGENLEFQLFEAVGGIKQQLKLASTATQAADPGYRAGGDLSVFYEMSTKAALELSSLLSVNLFEAKVEDSAPLAQTPLAELAFTPSTVTVPINGQPSEPVLIRATLDPVTYLGLQSVVNVQFFWKQPNGSLTSVCGVLVPDHAGQREFECELQFTDAHVGTQYVYAFVTARIFGVPFGVPFELGDDARVSIEVVREEPLAFLTTALPDGKVGEFYSAQVWTTGGSGPLDFVVDAGALPAGLVLNASTGAITGTPTEACACGLSIRVTRGTQSVSALFTLTVVATLQSTTFAGTIVFSYPSDPPQQIDVKGLVVVSTPNQAQFSTHQLELYWTALPSVPRGSCALDVIGGVIQPPAALGGFTCSFRHNGQTYESTSASISATSVTASLKHLSFAGWTAQLSLTAVPEGSRKP